MEYNNLIAELNKIGTRVVEDYKDALVKGKVSATGKLFNSIDYRVDVNTDNLEIKFIAEDYFVNIENGRKAGGKMPPISAIKKWMISRGLGDSNSKAFSISRSISKSGIKPRPYLRKIESKLNKYDKELSAALAKDIKEHLDKELKNNNKNGNINTK